MLILSMLSAGSSPDEDVIIIDRLFGSFEPSRLEQDGILAKSWLVSIYEVTNWTDAQPNDKFRSVIETDLNATARSVEGVLGCVCNYDYSEIVWLEFPLDRNVWEPGPEIAGVYTGKISDWGHSVEEAVQTHLQSKWYITNLELGYAVPKGGNPDQSLPGLTILTLLLALGIGGAAVFILRKRKPEGRS